MQGLAATWLAADGVGRAVALGLLLMSVASWTLLLWKAWALRRAAADLARGVPAFWDAASLAEGRARLAALDREALLRPLLDAALLPPAEGTLHAGNPPQARLTRQLRDALHRATARLRHGQVVLASVGATAPFVGLFGTVWGIYHALLAVADAQTLALDRVAGPVGEALVMTAAGIAVAVPAVLAYNAHGQRIAALEAELEGFAQDLRDWALARRG